MSRVFTANPDPYGRFGHQLTSLLTSYLLAALTRQQFLPKGFTYFSNSWNSVIDFRRSSLAFTGSSHYLEQYIIPSYPLSPDGINNKCSFESAKAIFNFLSNFNGFSIDDRNALVELPFDQKPGILLRLLPAVNLDFSKTISHDYLKSLVEPNWSFLCNGYIAVHIRRGDINQWNHPTWYVPDNKILPYLQSIYVSHPCHPILITTDASGASLAEIQHVFSQIPNIIFSSNLEPGIPGAPRSHFDWALLFYASRILATMSSFSQSAFLLSGQTSVFQMLVPSLSNVLCLSSRIDTIPV